MNPSLFAQLLTQAVRTIAARENKTIASVQDDLGYALGRDGGSSIEYWRKAHVPADSADVTRLVQTLIQRAGLTAAEAQRFLKAGGQPQNDRASSTPTLLTRPSPPTHARPQAFSPFVAGPPITQPRQFFGRERELKRMFGLWRRFPMQHIAIIGPKRSGKTSLLHYVRTINQTQPRDLRPNQRNDWLPTPVRWAFVDFQDARMGQRERLLAHILAKLHLPQRPRCTLDSFMDTISQYLHTPAVILMDEISAGLAAPELDETFWWSLRSLVSHYANGQLAFAIAAHAAPDQLAADAGKPSPFFNIFQSLLLGPFPLTEAHALIASSPIPFSAEDEEWLVAQSERWPCLLQLLCQTRLIALENGDTDVRWHAEALQQIAPFLNALHSHTRT